ncbi:hypothetical protein JW824_07800 [bacterium]|nr:hypothetical protein [bacterium]
MQYRLILYGTLWLSLIGLGLSPILSAQTTDQSEIQQNTTEQIVSQQDSDGGEMVLEAIEIQGKVERPGVIIVPKRVEPEIEEIELERSFQQEVKEEMGQIPEPERELQSVDRIESIKKTIQKERE